ETLLTIPTDRSGDIWSMPSDGSDRPRRISRGLLDGAYGFSVAPDDRIVFQTLEAGQLDLAIMNADGSGKTLLTEDPDEDRYPSTTADGRVVWVSRGAGGIRLFEMALDDRKRRPLLDDPLTEFARPAVAAEVGVVFEHLSGGIPSLWRLVPGSSRPTQLTDYRSQFPAISHDGTRLAFVYFDEQVGLRIGITGIEGGPPILSIDQPVSTGSGSFVRWTWDDEALLINTVEHDRTNLWRLPLDGGEPIQWTDFDEKRLLWADYSSDGRVLFFSRGQISRDAVLIENFR
ncbi:MAG: hypothetical protein R3244_11365, partial [Thermoanaerobaculia bacterium]|nr:hypothetical protein [Thermoanaerobaculia bacterium]